MDSLIIICNLLMAGFFGKMIQALRKGRRMRKNAFTQVAHHSSFLVVQQILVPWQAIYMSM